MPVRTVLLLSPRWHFKHWQFEHMCLALQTCNPRLLETHDLERN